MILLQDEEKPEILADTTSWPSLDQVKVDTPTTVAPKEKKVTSPRDETTESQSSESPNADAAANKKKGISNLTISFDIVVKP